MATPNTVPFLSPGERRCAGVERGHSGTCGSWHHLAWRRQGPWKYIDAELPLDPLLYRAMVISHLLPPAS